ncbi:MAG: S8 family peptidase [Sphingobacteriaceae bacterium]|nr:S8 family peptidase [Sphingobacteriaceae bacterium]
MKKVIFIVLIVVLQVTMFSQNKCNTFLKAQLTDKTLPAQFDVLVDGNIPQLLKDQKQLGVQVNYYAGNIASVRTSLNSISNLITHKYVKFIEYRPSKPQLMNDTAMVRNRINPVKQGMAPLTQAYDGSGIIMGIIDTGIDFNHPDFKDGSGNTRIQFIWDQNQSSGSTIPMPYNYGIEWTAAQINASVCTHNDNANYGHGTHVSGTAAGNGLATGKFEGVAPKAELIVVALNFNNSTNPIYADALSYIFAKATAAGKPCVVNASVGDYYGSHDATDLQAQLMNNLITAQNGRVLVAAAGNAGNVKFHTKTTLINSDTLFTWFSDAVADMYYVLYADTNDIKNVQTSIGVNRASSTDLGRIPFHNYNYALTSQQVDTLKFNNKRIGIIKTDASINSFGVYELVYHVIADSLNYNWRIESKGNGKHDSWDFNFKNAGLPTATVYPKMINYVMPDTISTIVTGFQCSNEVITVGNYINLNKWTDATNTAQTSTLEVPGKIKETSSGGPTRWNMIKPDVVATGANVFSAMPISLQTFMLTNAPSAVAQGSMHIQGGGTSASAPVVAGLAALYLQKFPNATNQQVKQAIMNCTYSDGFTGIVPNNVYGYGKLDGMAAMLCTIFTGVERLNLNEGLKAMPNPFHGKVEINLKDKGVLFVYDINGKCLLKQNIDSKYVLSTDEINEYKGLLLIRILTETQTYSAKLISY